MPKICVLLTVLFFMVSIDAAPLAHPPQTAPKKLVRKTASSGKSKTKNPVQNQVQTLRTYDFELSNTGEILVLEEQMLDKRPAFFIEHRSGQKNLALASVSKKEFEVWTRGLDAVLQKPRTTSCDKAPKLKRSIKSSVASLQLCENVLSASEKESLSKIRGEILNLLKKNLVKKTTK